MRPIGLAGAIAVLALAGCSDGAAGSATAPPITPPTTDLPAGGAGGSAHVTATSEPAAGTAPGTTPVAPVAAPPGATPTAAAVDAPALLAAALGQMAAGYHFVTTATVGGQVAVSAEGNHVAGDAGPATQMTLRSSGVETEYVITPAAAWAWADDAWQELDRADSPSDPLAGLRAPQQVTLVAGDAANATLEATYPASALGLTGDQPVPVQFQLAQGTITSLGYADPAGTVTAAISPLAPGTVVTGPGGGSARAGATSPAVRNVADEA